MSDYSEVLNIESLKFNPFDSSEDILTDHSINFFNSNIGDLKFLKSHMKNIRI